MRPPVVQFLLTQKERRRPEIAATVVEIIMAMYSDLRQLVSEDVLAYIIAIMPEMVEYLLHKDYSRIQERLHKWYKRHDSDVTSLTELEITVSLLSGKSDAEMFMLFADIKKNRPQASKDLDIDTRICELLKTVPVLRDVSVHLAAAVSSTIRWVLRQDYKQALRVFVSTENLDIDDDAEAYILFGQNLSAAAEDTAVYLYFKKVWISYLLDCSRTEEARKELDEFIQLLPDDEDFINLRKRLNNS